MRSINKNLKKNRKSNKTRKRTFSKLKQCGGGHKGRKGGKGGKAGKAGEGTGPRRAPSTTSSKAGKAQGEVKKTLSPEEARAAKEAKVAAQKKTREGQRNTKMRFLRGEEINNTQFNRLPKLDKLILTRVQQKGMTEDKYEGLINMLNSNSPQKYEKLEKETGLDKDFIRQVERGFYYRREPQFFEGKLQMRGVKVPITKNNLKNINGTEQRYKENIAENRELAKELGMTLSNFKQAQSIQSKLNRKTFKQFNLKNRKLANNYTTKFKATGSKFKRSTLNSIKKITINNKYLPENVKSSISNMGKRIINLQEQVSKKPEPKQKEELRKKLEGLVSGTKGALKLAKELADLRRRKKSRFRRFYYNDINKKIEDKQAEFFIKQSEFFNKLTEFTIPNTQQNTLYLLGLKNIDV